MSEHAVEVLCYLVTLIQYTRRDDQFRVGCYHVDSSKRFDDLTTRSDLTRHDMLRYHGGRSSLPRCFARPEC